MASSTSSRSSSRGAPQAPSTPERSRPSVARASSFGVAPRSEYLRNALHARRAQNTPTPSPLEVQTPPPAASKPSQTIMPESPPDVFAEYALTEEQMTPVSPIRRRRPSDAGLSRSKTNKELTNEIERLKENLITANMRVELYKKDHSKLQHELTRTKERVEILEPLEQDNLELQAENDMLRHQLEKMDEEIARLKDDKEELEELRINNQELRKTNGELTAIASESAAHWDGQEAAIEEAAEIISNLEEDKTLLTDELKRFKEWAATVDMASPARTLVDGHSKYPSRVFSVDESRPSTSHFDSDYYSQPDSPQPKSSKESTISLTPSERSKKFLELSEERRRSIRDLVNRMSVASLRALHMETSLPVPKVPQLPAEFCPPTLRVVDDDRLKSTPRTPRRYRQGREAIPESLIEEAQYSPTRRGSLPRQVPMTQTEGLRGLYRPDKHSRSSTSYSMRSSRSRDVTPTNTTSLSLEEEYSIKSEVSPRVPLRDSSRHTHTSSSSEQSHMRRRRQSEPEVQTSLGNVEIESKSVAPGWGSSAPPLPVASVPSAASDLTTELDPYKSRDKHWRDLDRLTASQAQHRLNVPQSRRYPALTTQEHSGSRERDVRDSSKKNGQQSSSYDSLKKQSESQEQRTRTVPNTPQVEKNFLFNHEDEETFLQKTRAIFNPRK
ncbi:hypothetical protein ACN47E_002078 [Coniothyrium glycines]